MSKVIDDRLIEPDGEQNIIEDFNRVLNIVEESKQESEDNSLKRVVFDSDGGSSVSPQYLLVGEKVAQPANPTKSGYSFNGWYKGEVAYDFNSKVKDHMTLKAVWLNVYTVTFNSDGGSSVDAQSVVDGECATEPEDPTKEGNTFSGWFKGADEFDFTTAITENITLTAHWTADPDPENQGG